MVVGLEMELSGFEGIKRPAVEGRPLKRKIPVQIREWDTFLLSPHMFCDHACVNNKDKSFRGHNSLSDSLFTSLALTFISARGFYPRDRKRGKLTLAHKTFSE